MMIRTILHSRRVKRVTKNMGISVIIVFLNLLLNACSGSEPEPSIFSQSITLEAVAQQGTSCKLQNLKTKIVKIENTANWLSIIQKDYISGSPEIELRAQENTGNEDRIATVNITASSGDMVVLTVTQKEPPFRVQFSVDTLSVSNNSVQLKAEYEVKGCKDAYYYGICLGTSSKVSLDNYEQNELGAITTTNGHFIILKEFKELKAETTYYYVPYVSYTHDDIKTIYYGEKKSFTTKASTPTFEVTTNDATNIETTTATLNGSAVINNATESYKIGFLISTNSTPTPSNGIDYSSTRTSSSYNKSFTANATGLTSGTKYYYRAYVLYAGKYYYGTTKSFTTKSASFSCTIETNEAKNIGQTTVTLNGYCAVDNSPYSEFSGLGFVLSTSSAFTGDTGEDYQKSYDTGVDSHSKSFTRNLNHSFSGLRPNTKYYYKAYIWFGSNVYYYGSVKSFTTKSSSSSTTTGTLNGHDWVDLGLPSGTKWATCNIGASSPSGSGNYYAWGETSTKTSYSWNNYKYGNKNVTTVTNLGNNISGTKYDAAKANWGSTWRMPTRDECAELYHYCSRQTATVNGVEGVRFTSSNGNSIFVPGYTGYYNGNTREETNVKYGIYWTASLDNDSYAYAWFADMGSGTASSYWSIDRSYGMSIRPVTK